MFDRHARATLESNEDLGPYYVRDNDTSYEAQGLEEIREKAFTLKLQNRKELRIKKEKRRERQVLNENLIVLYKSARRSFERELHSSTYEELLSLARH